MYTGILHATDLTKNHFEMCEKSVEIAKRFKAPLYLLHVIELPPTLQLAQGLGFSEIEDPTLLLNDAKAVLSTLGETFHIPEKHLFVEVGSIKQHTFDKLKSLHCQLIIIGHHTPSNMPVCLGSTAQLIVQEATCDVLTLK